MRSGGFGGIVLLLSLSNFCCSPLIVKKEFVPPEALALAPRFPPALNKIIALRVTEGEDVHYGMGCPFSESLAYTAAHLAKLGPVESINSDGHVKALRTLAINTEHDLALLGGDFTPIPLAPSAPVVGDKVYTRGMLPSGQHTAFEGNVLGITPAGDILIDGWGAPGMSGSCVLNEKGETVGDMKYLSYSPDRVTRTMNGATLVTDGAPFLLRRPHGAK